MGVLIDNLDGADIDVRCECDRCRAVTRRTVAARPANDGKALNLFDASALTRREPFRCHSCGYDRRSVIGVGYIGEDIPSWA